MRGRWRSASRVVCVLLGCSWGGSRYPWMSPEVLGAFAAGALALAAFVWIARRAPEPLLPLGAVPQRVFSVSSLGVRVVGSDAVRGHDLRARVRPGRAGRLGDRLGRRAHPAAPHVDGHGRRGGQIISRTGRYRAFPIVGSVLVILGAVLLSLLDAGLVRARRRARRPLWSASGWGRWSRRTSSPRRTRSRHVGRRDRDRRAAVLPLDGRQRRGRRARRAAGHAAVDRAEHEAGRRRVADRPGPPARGKRRDPRGLVPATQHALAARCSRSSSRSSPSRCFGLVVALRLEERPLRTRAAGEPA